jgi:hypothetical protein
MKLTNLFKPNHLYFSSIIDLYDAYHISLYTRKAIQNRLFNQPGAVRPPYAFSLINPPLNTSHSMPEWPLYLTKDTIKTILV